MDNRTQAPYPGRCTCGQVHYQLLAAPMFIHCCHCRWCQRETGTAFALNGMIEASQLQLLQGETETIELPSNSGKGQKVTRCSRCRIALWSNYGGAGDAVHFVRIGTLNNPDRFPPDIHIYTASKQPWLKLPADTPATEAYYKAGDYWPQASMARFKKALGK